jgi:cytochrome c556
MAGVVSWGWFEQSAREGTAELLADVEKKDAAAAKAAFEKTTSACAACHKVHRTKQ